MAKTGINIQVRDTLFGTSVDRNVESAIVLFRCSAVDSGIFDRFVGDNNEFAVAELTGPVDYSKYEAAFDTATEAPILRDWATITSNLVSSFYEPVEGISLLGAKLHVAATSDKEITAGSLDVAPLLKYWANKGIFPRQILFAPLYLGSAWGVLQPIAVDSFAMVSNVNNALSTYKMRSVVLLSYPHPPASGSITPIAGVSERFSVVSATRKIPYEASFGIFDESSRALGLLAHVSVGTSIGDCSLPIMPEDVGLYTDDADVYTPNDSVESLDAMQVIYPRRRYPRVGSWFNDGSTIASPENALSTLESVRTLYAICDDLQDYFTTYINGRVPVTASGDIQSTFKQVVLDNARAKVIDKYIASGDISDARVSLVAKDNDMVGTRTWEVSVSILPAPTLRWIEGYVFYVNKLS